MIWLKHERHGVKIAYGDAEARADELHGWVRFTPEQPEQLAETDRKVLRLKRGDGSRSDQKSA